MIRAFEAQPGWDSAAIVTGNWVVYTPSSPTPSVGHNLVEAFWAAGLPAGFFNYVTGRTDVIAEHLINHHVAPCLPYSQPA